MSTQPKKIRRRSGREWEQLKSQVRDQWNTLDDDDLQQAEGDVEALIAVVQRKTGEAREHVEQFVNHLADELLPRLHRMGEAAASLSADAVDAAKHQYDRAADGLKEGYASAQSSVRRRPTQSVAIAFGVGVVAGLLTSSIVRTRG